MTPKLPHTQLAMVTLSFSWKLNILFIGNVIYLYLNVVVWACMRMCIFTYSPVCRPHVVHVCRGLRLMCVLTSLYRSNKRVDLELPWLASQLSQWFLSLPLTHWGYRWLSCPHRFSVGSGDLKFGLHNSSVSPAQYIFLIVLYFFESNV